MCVATHNPGCTARKDSTALGVDGGILWASMDWEYKVTTIHVRSFILYALLRILENCYSQTQGASGSGIHC